MFVSRLIGWDEKDEIKMRAFHRSLAGRRVAPHLHEALTGYELPDDFRQQRFQPGKQDAVGAVAKVRGNGALVAGVGALAVLGAVVDGVECVVARGCRREGVLDRIDLAPCVVAPVFRSASVVKASSEAFTDVRWPISFTP